MDRQIEMDRQREIRKNQQIKKKMKMKRDKRKEKRKERKENNQPLYMDLSCNFIRKNYEDVYNKNITNLYSLSIYTLLVNKYDIDIITLKYQHDTNNTNNDYKYNPDICAIFNRLLISINNINDYDVYKLANVKYTFYNNLINDKMFLLNKTSSNTITNIFNECQTFYFNLIQLKKKIVYKLSKKYDIDEDLRSNKLKDIKKENLIELIDNKTIYKFRISDMVNIVENSLCSCEYEMLHNPLPPKNPFTNTPFTKSFFINLYFKVKHSNLKIPTLFHNFFLCYFDLKIFEIENDVLIREQVIARYLKNLTQEEYYDNIMKMLKIVKRQYKLDIILNIDQLCPKNMVVDALKNYYHCFLYSEHSVNRYKNGIFTRIFKKSISAFNRYNKIFGRLVYYSHHCNNPKFISHYLEYKNVNKYLKEQEALDCYEPDTVTDNEINANRTGYIRNNISIFNPRHRINEILNNHLNIIEDNIHNDDNSLSSSSSSTVIEEIDNNDNDIPLYPTSSDEEKDDDDMDVH
jgi:hypothetical protein